MPPDDAQDLQAQLDALQARLAEADRLRSAFVQNVAHELSNPLTPIVGYLKILQSEKLGTLSAQQRKVLESVANAVTRLRRVVENLSDFANLRVGTVSLGTSPVDADALVNDVVEELRAAIKEAHLHVQVVPSRGAPVLADERKLRQAISNLVGNAVKFSSHGGEVLVAVSRASDRLRVEVWDQGPGIPAEDQAHVFEPLFHARRTNRATEARRPGSGLGLPVARRIAEAHGGRVLLESPPSAQPAGATHPFPGTRVVLEIPVAAAP